MRSYIKFLIIFLAVAIITIGGLSAYQYFTKPKVLISDAKIEQGLTNIFEITWSSSGINKINIDLLNGDGSKNRVIAQGINNQNKYTWIIEDLAAWRSWDGPFEIVISDANNSLIKTEIKSFTASGAYPASNYEETADWKTYTNTQYGFEISLPEFWSNYVIDKNSFWDGVIIGSPPEGPDYTGQIVLIKNPKLESENKFRGIPIMVITPDVWKLISEEKVAVSAAPIGPSKIGENSEYVFATPPRYIGFADTLNTEEINQIYDIVKTFKVINSSQKDKFIVDMEKDFIVIRDLLNKKVLQSILVPEAGLWIAQRNNLPYEDIFNYKDDINFDGYKDLKIISSSGYMGVNLFYDYYVFNPTTNRFEEFLTDMCNPDFQKDQKEIRSSCKDGPSYADYVYKFNGKNYIKTN